MKMVIIEGKKVTGYHPSLFELRSGTAGSRGGKSDEWRMDPPKMLIAYLRRAKECGGVHKVYKIIIRPLKNKPVTCRR